ncbi:hypothetical protein PSC71_12270 [Devosia sp. J2-20]|uniref:hypothetical protein n=1 Tax=Devosia sp. J2-20 TaxID=3026161 RepID=UPI00249A7C48|nr:hypothetical protein [Devosia sp. J2-20]WDQ98015.1 hypothetical protein PSC71_12270 [Devosia sp. J2-20]
MGAGTAQKIALNMFSTMVAVHLGHVHDGYMVNVVADNAKLRDRARRIVMDVTGVTDAQAAHWLALADGAVKPAIVLAAGADGMEAARRLLELHNGQLRPALKTLGAKLS